LATDAFSEIFKRLDRELWLITAQAGTERSGLIATYVASVSLVPSLPRVTIALAKHHFTCELIEKCGAFCMHLIGREQIDWVWHFGIQSGRNCDKLAACKTVTGQSGAPRLIDALAWLDCRVESRLDAGDRIIYLAEALDARLERSEMPLTFNQLLQLAPAEKLRELKLGTERDVEFDRQAILDWRRRVSKR